MRILRALIFLAGIASWQTANANQKELVECEAQFLPTLTVSPKLKINTRYFIEGHGVVRINIDKQGTVSGAAIVTSTWREKKYGQRVIASYEKPVIAAFLEWSYPSRSVGCTMEVPFKLRTEG